jgi:sugar lactone lactonase YvrE
LAPATTGASGAELAWTTSNATIFSVDHGVGTVTGTSVSVAPTATTTYTLTAANSVGATATATVTVKVRDNLAAAAGAAYAGGNPGFPNYNNGQIIPCAYPSGAATDGSGNLFVIDWYDQTVCKVSTTGAVTVLASNGVNSWVDDVVGTVAARLKASHSPSSKAKSFVSRFSSNAHAKAAAKGAVVLSNDTSNAGFADLSAIAVSSDGKTIYVADDDDQVVRRIVIASDGTTSIATVAGANGQGYLDGAGSVAMFDYPEGLTLDASGNLYVADEDNDAIRKIVVAADGTSTVSTVAGGPSFWGHQDGPAASALLGYLTGIAASGDGTAIYFADEYDDSSYIREIAISGKGNATVSTVTGGPHGYTDSANGPAAFGYWCPGLALSSDGTTLYVADVDNDAVREIALGTATVSTLAGNGTWGQQDGLGNVAELYWPTGVALDASGNLFVTDGGDNGEDMVAPVTNTKARSANRPIADRPGRGEDASYSLAEVREVALSTTQVSTVVLNVFGNTGGSADGAGATAGFEFPGAVVSDSSGNLYVSDTLNSTIRKITFASDGTATVSTVAGTAGVSGWADGTGSAAEFVNPVNLAIDPAGASLYVQDAGNRVIRQIDLATGAVATLDIPYFGAGIAADVNGNLYSAIPEDGLVLVTDVPSGVDLPLVLTDPSGNPYYFWDAYSLALYKSSDKSQNVLYVGEDCDVVKVDLLTNIATPLAGNRTVCGYQDGTGTGALFDEIESIAVDSQGNVYAADLENNVIRRITPAGVVTTVVGTYGSTTAALGLLPASILMPYGVAVDPSDNLIVTVPNAVLYLQP